MLSCCPTFLLYVYVVWGYVTGSNGGVKVSVFYMFQRQQQSDKKLEFVDGSRTWTL